MPPGARLRGLPWIITVVALSTGASGLTAQRDSAFTPAIVELRIMGGPDPEVVVALVRDSTLLVPVRTLLDLAGIRVVRAAPPTPVTGTLEPSGIRFAFDLANGVRTRGEVTQPLGPRDAAWYRDDLYVATEHVAEVLDVAIMVDWVELIVVVWQTDHLPAVRARTIARRREALLRRLRGRPPPPLLPTRARPTDGAVLDWALSTTTRDPIDASGIDLGLGAHVAGGSLTLELTHRRSTAGAFTATEGAWTRAWTTQPWLRQVSIGDVAGTGRRFTRIRGLAVTNAPFVRSAAFARDLLTGQLPPDWEVELYQGDQLIDFTPVDARGRYQFELPIQYGPNPVDVIAYGPHGEQRVFRRTFDIPFARLPAGEFEYAASVGECRFDPCQATLNLDTRYGLSPNVSVRGGTDVFWRDTLPDLIHPYLVAAVSPVRAVNIEVTGVARALIEARVGLAPTPDFGIDLTHTVFSDEVRSPIIGSSNVRHRTFGSLFWRPSRRDRGVFFRLTGLHLATEGATRYQVRAATTARFGPARGEVALRRERTTVGATRFARTGVDFAVDASLRGPRALRGAFLRGEAFTALDSGLTGLGLLIGRPVYTGTRVDLRASWHRGPRGFGVELTITTALRTIRAVSRNSVNRLNGVQGVHFAEGSLVWDRVSGRVVAADGRSLGRSGVAGEIFLDEDGDGTRDSAEISVPDLRLRVGGHRVETDSLGRFSVWDVLPFEPVTLEIDSMSIRNPLWTAAHPAVAVAPAPNGFSHVALPLIVAGRIAGRLTFAETGAGVGGVTVFLTHRESGATTRLTTFMDGAFFALGIRPGPYHVEVDPGYLARARLRSEPAAFTITAGQPDETEVTLTLRP